MYGKTLVSITWSVVWGRNWNLCNILLWLFFPQLSLFFLSFIYLLFNKYVYTKWVYYLIANMCCFLRHKVSLFGVSRDLAIFYERNSQTLLLIPQMYVFPCKCVIIYCPKAALQQRNFAPNTNSFTFFWLSLCEMF